MQLIAILLILFFTFSIYKDFNNGLTSVNNSNSEIKEIQKALERMEKEHNVVMQTMTKYNLNVSALKDTPCYSCHIEPDMWLPKSHLSRDEFFSYVSGEKRHITNTTMPKFSTEISHNKLDMIYASLYLR